MQVGSSPGGAAAVQLMQATNSLKSVTGQQIQAVNNNLDKVKSDALQHSAQQVASSVERKQNSIDLMA